LIAGDLDAMKVSLDAEKASHLELIRQKTEQTKLFFWEGLLAELLLILLLGSVATYFLIIRPLKVLTSSMTGILEGDLSKRLETDPHDQFGILANAYNALADKFESEGKRMAQQLKERTAAFDEISKKFEEKSDELEKSQVATINLLEDLEEDKAEVEQKVAERTADLTRERHKLLQVTSNMRGGAILLDEAKNVVFTNENAHAILGVPSDQVSSALILKAFYSYFSSSNIQDELQRCFNGESFRIPEIEGGGKVYEVFFHYIQDSSDPVMGTIGYFILFYDITDAKLLERSKSELVAVASHQLRTPLTAMRGNVEMLVDESFGPLNKEQHELLDDVEVSTIRLITMVNEMLDITKIEKGDLEMSLEVLNVMEILQIVAKDLSSYAQRHEFVISLDGVDPQMFVYGDRVRVLQIFQNLTDNAIKYSSHPGRLDVSTSLKEKFVEIAFKDNGIGVPQNEQSKLFGRFYRASNTAKTASSGSGLGLYIVKSIARQLGGDISFKSQEGVGTTFYVLLPLSDKNNNA
jgi:signal transduction histidine kinase